MGKRTVVVQGTWWDTPLIDGEDIRGHCVEKIGPGVYRHHRLSTVIVCLAEIGD